jgi:uncharacterized membrane protein (UPF0127 family)
MRWPAPLLALVVAATVAIACSSPRADRDPETGRLTILTRSGEVTLHVEIASTEGARATGLMRRTSLGEDAGMVFLFGQPSDGPFWMKDTLIPLSIAFWAADGRVLAILDMDPCRADPCHLYSPGVTYVGAVEVNQGWFAAHDVRVGDTVELMRDG